MKHGFRFIVIPCAAALGMSLFGQTTPQTPSQPGPAPQTSATQQAAPPNAQQKPDAQQKPEKTEKPKKVSRHNRHEAEKMFQAGAQAIVQNDPLSAEKDFLKAHDLDPDNERYPLSAEVARQFVITQTVQKAEKARILGHSDQARAALAEAMKLDPRNPMLLQNLNALADEATAELPEMEQKGDDVAPPIELAPENAVRSFHLRADEQSLIRQVLNAYGIQSTLDPSVKSQIVRFDVDNVGFAQASNILKLVTNTFFSPLDPIHVVVAADTKENRAKYEHQAMEVVYFPGLNATELSEMGSVARNIYGAEHGLVQASENTMTIRAPSTTLAALNQTYTELLDGRSELVLEVRMYEVDKSHERNVGVILPSSTTVFNIPSELNSVIANNSSLVQQIISSGLASAGDYSAIAAILVASGALSGTVFNTPFATFGGGLSATGVELNGASANLLLNSSSVRSINKLQLRVTDQEEATLRSGERYPILTSSYSSLTPTSSIPSSLLSSLGLGSSGLGASSTSQIIPQVQYQDLGLTLTMKPHIEGERDVSLKLSLKLDSLQGSTINSIPVLSNREYGGTISLRPGDSAMVASAISKTESLEINGIPGLSDIPGLQDTTNRDNTVDTTELVIVVTPQVVRLAHRETAGKMLLLPQHP